MLIVKYLKGEICLLFTIVTALTSIIAQTTYGFAHGTPHKRQQTPLTATHASG